MDVARQIAVRSTRKLVFVFKHLGISGISPHMSYSLEQGANKGRVAGLIHVRALHLRVGTQ